MASDQRKLPRHPVNQRGELHFAGRGRLRVRVIDISVQGAGVAAETAVPVGARGELVLQLGAPAPLRFIGAFVVADVTLAGGGYRIGLAFAPLAPEVNAALVAYGKARASGQAALLRPD